MFASANIEKMKIMQMCSKSHRIKKAYRSKLKFLLVDCLSLNLKLMNCFENLTATCYGWFLKTFSAANFFQQLCISDLFFVTTQCTVDGFIVFNVDN